MEEQDYFECRKCHRKVSKINQIYHELSCGASEEIREGKSSLSKEFTKREESYPSFNPKYAKESLLDSNNKKESDFATICPKCTQPLLDSEVAQHINTCSYQACRFCLEYYPDYLIIDHQFVCPQRTQSNGTPLRGSQNSFLDSQPTPDNSMNNGSEQSTPARTSALRRQPNASNGNIIFTTVTRTPFGMVSNTQSITFNGAGGSNRHFSPFGFVFDDEESSNPGSTLDPFQRLFLDHGNFMRMNRLVLNIGVLDQLIEQLYNPNHGMSRERLARVEEIVFHKNENCKAGEEEKCSICISEFENEEKIKRLPCGHLFHGNCINTWLVQNSLCPICKTNVSDQLGDQARP